MGKTKTKGDEGETAKRIAVRWLNLPVAGICAAILLASLILGLLASGPASLSISGNDVRVFKAAFKDTRRPNISDPVILLRDQLGTFPGEARQFHLVRDAEQLDAQNTAIHVPIIGGPASLYVNNVRVAETVAVPASAPGLGRQSLYANVSPELFLPGLNRIDVRLETDPGRLGVGPVYIGPQDKLAEASSRLGFLRGALGLLLLPLAILAILSGLVTALLAGRVIGGAAMAMTGIGLALLHSGTLGVLALTGTSAEAWLSPLCLSVGLGFSAFRLSYDALMSRRFICGAAIMGAVFSLFALLRSVSPSWSAYFEPASLISGVGIQLSTAIVSLGLIWAASRTFRNQLSEAQARIDSQAATIRAQEAQLADTIRRTAIVEERQRFTRDMHDGIGGQLTSLLIRLRSGRADLDVVEKDLQSGLSDLRNIVDSLDHVGDDLDSAFATFRTRAEQQVTAAGLDFTWEQSGSLDSVDMDTREVLHTFRLLQEAVTNITRHADATHVKISIDLTPQALSLVVADNGKGFDPSTSRVGRGIRSLRERAEKLGGDLEIDSAPGDGTRVGLTIPQLSG